MTTLLRKLIGLSATVFALSCQTAVSTEGANGVYLPFLKNSPNECYFIDDFMPVPDGMVAGKNGTLDVRYYTYKLANYKSWRLKQVMLSFYSTNGRCWSLYEEYYIAE